MHTLIHCVVCFTGSRIGRQPNSIKHKTMLELQQLKSGDLNTPTKIKSEPDWHSHSSGPPLGGISSSVQQGGAKGKSPRETKPQLQQLDVLEPEQEVIPQIHPSNIKAPEQGSYEKSLVSQQPSNITAPKQGLYEKSLVSQQPSNITAPKHRSYREALVAQQPSNITSPEQGSYEKSLVSQQPSNITAPEQRSYRETLVPQQPSNITALEQRSYKKTLVPQQQQSNIPALEQGSYEKSLVSQQPSNITALEQRSYREALVPQQPSNIPASKQRSYTETQGSQQPSNISAPENRLYTESLGSQQSSEHPSNIPVPEQRSYTETLGSQQPSNIAAPERRSYREALLSQQQPSNIPAPERSYRESVSNPDSQRDVVFVEPYPLRKLGKQHPILEERAGCDGDLIDMHDRDYQPVRERRHSMTEMIPRPQMFLQSTHRHMSYSDVAQLIRIEGNRGIGQPAGTDRYISYGEKCSQDLMSQIPTAGPSHGLPHVPHQLARSPMCDNRHFSAMATKPQMAQFASSNMPHFSTETDPRYTGSLTGHSDVPALSKDMTQVLPSLHQSTAQNISLDMSVSKQNKAGKDNQNSDCRSGQSSPLKTSKGEASEVYLSTESVGTASGVKPAKQSSPDVKSGVTDDQLTLTGPGARPGNAPAAAEGRVSPERPEDFQYKNLIQALASAYIELSPILRRVSYLHY